jgi:hypothetical protein
VRFGYNSQAVLEGCLVRKVLVAEKNAGNPARTADATAQIQAADPNNEFGRATLAAAIPLPFAGAPEHFMLAGIRSASLIWKSLVETGAIFDFKNTVLVRPALAGADCPPMCPGDPTITTGAFALRMIYPGTFFMLH